MKQRTGSFQINKIVKTNKTENEKRKNTQVSSIRKKKSFITTTTSKTKE